MRALGLVLAVALLLTCSRRDPPISPEDARFAITGRIRTACGDAVTTEEFWAQLAGDAYTGFRAKVDGDGRFRIEGLRAGDYELAGLPVRRTVHVPPDAVDVDLVLPCAEIHACVVDAAMR